MRYVQENDIYLNIFRMLIGRSVLGADVANMNVLISRKQVKPLLSGFKAKHRGDIDIMHMQPLMECLSKMSDQE